MNKSAILHELSDSVIPGPNGTRYLPPSVAARRLNKSTRQIDGLVGRQELGSTRDGAILKLAKGPGRRPAYLVLAADVDDYQAKLLDDMGVLARLQKAEATVESVRSSWERETIALRARVAALEEQAEAILSAVDLRFRATRLQAEADAEFVRALRGSFVSRVPDPGG